MAMNDSGDGQVMFDSYCMKKSIEAKNNAEMNAKLGYNNMSDRANTPKPPVQMKAAKSNPQLSPQAGKNKYDY